MKKPYDVTWFGLCAGVAVLQYLFVRLGLVLGIAHGNVSPVWPATGFAIAVLLRFGVNLWPGVIFGSFLGLAQTGVGIPVAIGEALAALLEAVTAVWLVRRWIGTDDPFSRTSDVARFCFVTGVVATAVSATVGVSSLCFGRISPWESFPYLWGTWWLGDMMGALIVAPFIIVWTMPDSLRLDRRTWAKTAIVWILLILVGVLAFWGPVVRPTGTSGYPIAFLTLPIVVCAAFVAGRRGATAACLICSAMAISGTVLAWGPFWRGSVNEALLLLQGYLVVVSATAMILASVLRERNRALEGLRESQEDLEKGISERTQELLAANVQLKREVAERAQVEEALRESEERYRNFFATSRDAVFMTSVDGRFIDFNDVALETFGYAYSQRQEALGKRVIDFYADPKDREAYAAKVSEVGFFKEYPLDLRKKDGSIMHTLITTIARKNHQGDIIGFQGTVRDITERKRAEELLRESEEKYRHLFEKAPIGIFSLNREGRILEVNQKLLDILGSPSAQATKSINMLTFPPLVKSGLSEAFRRCLETAESVNAEVPYTSKWGKTSHLRAIVTPVLGPQRKHVTGCQSVVEDVTERKLAEEELRTTLDRFYTILSSLYAGVLIVTDEDRVEFVNQAFCDLFDLDDHPESLQGLTVPEMLAKIGDVYADPQKTFSWIRELVASQIPVRGEEVAVRGGRTYLVDFIPIRVNEESSGRLWHHTDITERKIIEERANEMARLAKAASIAKSEFLANMSHEIRTPVSGVIGMTELLLDTELSYDQRRFADTVRLSAESLLGLLNDILDFSKIEAGKLHLEILPFNLQTLMDDLVATMAFSAHCKGLEILCFIDPAVPTMLFGDPGRLRQILTNFAGNAIKFTPSGEVVIGVTLESETDKDALLRFAVTDTGIGVAKDKLGLPLREVLSSGRLNHTQVRWRWAWASHLETTGQS